MPSVAHRAPASNPSAEASTPSRPHESPDGSPIHSSWVHPDTSHPDLLPDFRVHPAVEVVAGCNAVQGPRSGVSTTPEQFLH